MAVTIAYGITTFGRVDIVPGLFSVATRFFHVSYVPLVPLGSYVVVDENEEGIRGVRIPLSVKSYFLAWFQTLAIYATMIFGVAALFQLLFPSNRTKAVWCLAFAVGSFLLLWLSKHVFYASRMRALQLAAQVGYPAEIVGLVFEARRLSAERRREARDAAFAARRAAGAPAPGAAKPRPEPVSAPAYRAPESPRGWRPPPPPSALAAATCPPTPASADAPDAPPAGGSSSDAAGPRFLR